MLAEWGRGRVITIDIELAAILSVPRSSIPVVFCFSSNYIPMVMTRVCFAIIMYVVSHFAPFLCQAHMAIIVNNNLFIIDLPG